MRYEAMTEENAQELLAQADILVGSRKYKEALDIAHSVYQSASEQNLNEIVGKSCSQIGNIYLQLSDYQSAFKYLQESIVHFEQIDSAIDIARTFGNIGVIYMRKSDYDHAFEYFSKALGINEEIGFKEGIAKNIGNLGTVYETLSKYPEALENYLKAVAIFEELGQKENAVRNLNNVGNVYKDISDYPRSLYYHHKAMALNEELGLSDGVAANLGNIGIVYKELGDYSRALECYFKALDIHTEHGNREKIANNIGNIGIVYSLQGEHDRALEYFQKALRMYEEVGHKYGIASNLGNIGNAYQEKSNFPESLKYYERTLELFVELDIKVGIAITYQIMGALYANIEYEGYNSAKAEEYLLNGLQIAENIGARKYIYEIHKVLAKLYKQEERWKESQENFEKFYEMEREIQSEETKKQAENLAYERKMAEREKNIEIERVRAQATDTILANILPVNITERLIRGDKKIADTYENVSVLFADIVGFTKISSHLPATELIDLLDIVFTRFDTICKKYGLEKIKTIGDAYMAVCGAPVASEDHAERTAQAAIKMLEDFEIEQKFSIPVKLSFRIGLHCGSVVAGIIGENKYSYDLWGDAVNTASRMESHGEEDKIHVSEEFKKSAGGGFRFSERGEMDIKGKGMMKTFFLEQITNIEL